MDIILFCVRVYVYGFKDHYAMHSTSQPEYLILEIKCVRGSHIFIPEVFLSDN